MYREQVVVLVIIMLAAIPALPVFSDDLGTSSVAVDISMPGVCLRHYSSASVCENILLNLRLQALGGGLVEGSVAIEDAVTIRKAFSSVSLVSKTMQYTDSSETVLYEISDYNGGTFIAIRLCQNMSFSVYLATDYEFAQYSALSMLDPGGGTYRGLRLLLQNPKFSSVFDCSDVEVEAWLKAEHAPNLWADLCGIPKDLLPGGENSFNLASDTGPRVYFLNHYMKELQSANMLTIGQTIIDYSWVTHELRRVDPSVAQVKSDLKFCSKFYYYRPEYYSRILGAYMVHCHGNYDEAGLVWFVVADGAVNPYDIMSCWISSDEYYCRPQDCIISMLICYGLKYPSLANAFLYYGAAAYVGPETDIVVNQNLWIGDFWGTYLAIGDTTVGYACANSRPSDKDCYYPDRETRVLPN